MILLLIFTTDVSYSGKYNIIKYLLLFVSSQTFCVVFKSFILVSDALIRNVVNLFKTFDILSKLISEITLGLV